jgi:hypothetical protein
VAERRVRGKFANLVMVLATLAATGSGVVAHYVGSIVRPHRLATAGEAIQRLDIIDKNGRIRSILPGHDAGCIMIRYGSKRCPFSVADREPRDRLYAAASDAACTTIVAAPTADELECAEPSCSDDHLHLVATSFETASGLRLAATPSTLVLDKHLRVVWSKLGGIDESSLLDALAGLARVRAKY